MRLAYLVVLTLLLTSCAASSSTRELPGADEAYLQGTWVSASAGDEEQVFLPDHQYCTYESVGDTWVTAIGTWGLSQPGYAYVCLSNAKLKHMIEDDGTCLIPIVKRVTEDRMLMGYSCSHCPGGIAGFIYTRAIVQRISCGRMPPENPN